MGPRRSAMRMPGTFWFSGHVLSPFCYAVGVATAPIVVMPPEHYRLENISDKARTSALPLLFRLLPFPQPILTGVVPKELFSFIDPFSHHTGQRAVIDCPSMLRP